MLGGGLDTTGLHTENGFVSSFSSEERVTTESFLITSALGNGSHVHSRTEGNIDTLGLEFLADRESARPDQITVPSTSSNVRFGKLYTYIA